MHVENIASASGNRDFRYDWNNRLIAVVDSETQEVIASYTYDALGRRRQKQVGEKTTNYYSNSGQVIYVEGEQSYTVGYIDGIPAFLGDFSFCTSYPEEPCAPTKNYVLTDNVGSVVGILRPSTEHSTPTTFAYDAFGNLLFPQEIRDNQIGFAGALWDAHAQIWHFLFANMIQTWAVLTARSPGICGRLKYVRLLAQQPHESRRSPGAIFPPSGGFV